MKRKQLAESTVNRNIDKLIEGTKFLKDAKYHKNNYWSWAHWESSAAKGYAGGCRACGVDHYNAHLHNKRYNNNRQKARWQDRGRITGNMCSGCVKILETKLGVEFKRSYAS